MARAAKVIDEATGLPQDPWETRPPWETWETPSEAPVEPPPPASTPPPPPPAEAPRPPAPPPSGPLPPNPPVPPPPLPPTAPSWPTFQQVPAPQASAPAWSAPAWSAPPSPVQGPLPQIPAQLENVIWPGLLQQWQADQSRRQAFEDRIRAQVLDLMRQGAEPVDVNAVTGSPEARAFARIHERGLQRFREQQAESRGRAGVGGVEGAGIGGALGSDIAGGQQELAERISGFESQLMARELQQRRQQLMQALSMGAGIMQDDQRQQIQRELTQIDTSLRSHLGRADIGLRGFLGGGQLSLGLLGHLMQNQQFYDALGYDLGGREAQLQRGSVSPFF